MASSGDPGARGYPWPVMFERFAEEARRATALASQSARELGHDFIGTEHLLLGLLATGEGTAFSVLTELEVTLDDARRKVTERVHAYGSESVESPPFTPLAKKSLERALREALQLDAKVIGSEHLLLGLIAVPDGGGARILGELAGSLDQVRQAVLDRIGPRPPTGPPVEQTKAVVTGRTLRRWAAQGRTVFRPPESSESSESSEGSDESEQSEHGPSGPGPRCPSCQSPLETQAKYRRLSVAPGPEDPPSTEGPSDAVTVTFVYCGNCGVSLGTI
ncbi:MAG: hypothetical protein QOJ52_2065 [Acidimicrobiaceae bacterium]|nr:hypothetical protein [Acidimicrobiaceae bacterium]